MASRARERWFVRDTRCRCCGRRFSVYGTPWGSFVRLAPGERSGRSGGCGHDRWGAVASAQSGEAEALLAYLAAPLAERERIQRRILQEVASARLDEATLLEALDEGPPEDPALERELPERLAAARARVVAGAHTLLRMRAAAAVADLDM